MYIGKGVNVSYVCYIYYLYLYNISSIQMFELYKILIHIWNIILNTQVQIYFFLPNFFHFQLCVSFW
jgi:hypothetical protein